MQGSFIKAACLMVLSSVAIAIMSALGKAAAPLINTAIVVFFQNLISFLIILPWALRKQAGGVKTLQTRWHIVRAITGAGAWYAMFLAMRFTSMSNAVLLIYSAALWIPLLSWLVLKQSISGKVWCGVAIGFIGIVLILHPGNGNAFNPGDLIALAAGFGFAIALLTVGQLNQTEPPFRILFYYFLFSSLLFLPLAISHWQSFSLKGWIYLVGIGVSLAVSQLLVILAYQLASATRLSPFMYSTLLFTAILDWLIWQQVPTIWMIAGMLLVVLGGLATAIEKGK